MDPADLTSAARRRALLQTLPWLLLTGPAVALAAPATPATTGAPDRTASATTATRATSDAERGRRARLERLRRLEALEREAEAARSDAGLLVQALQTLDVRRRSSAAALEPTRAALRSIDEQTMPALDRAAAAWRDARQAADDGAAAHLAALQALLLAPATGRAAAMDALDAAADRRRRTEQAEDAARQALADTLATAEHAMRQLAWLWQNLAQPVAANQATLRGAAQDWAALQRRWHRLRSALQAAGVHGPAWPRLRPIAPWAVPPDTPTPPPPDGAPLPSWQQALATGRSATRALRLLGDARAAVQQALADIDCAAGTPLGPASATDTAGSACAAWRADGERLRDDARRQLAAQADADAAQARSQTDLRDLPARAGAALQALQAWRGGIDGAVDQAGGTALQQLQAAITASATAQSRLAEARRRAEDALRNDMAAEMQRQASIERGELQFDPPGAGRPSPAASLSQPIRSHALHRLHRRDDEPAGFSAYTYVLVGAGVTPTTPGVQARLQRLLDAVRSLPAASGIATGERAGLNTFVVPVPADNGERDPLVVDLTLAQSLLTHLPPALRLADATRRQLYVANGPFLVTLPGRLSDARADWPLLFADLSRTPEVVVADVARRYMADLIGNFSPASTDWSPPAGMAVSIALVRMVKGSGDVVQAVFGGFGR